MILGHTLSRFVGKSDLVKIIYSSIYTVHMPIFIFINGLYGKRFKIKSTLNLLAVYTLWQIIIYPIFVGLFGGSYKIALCVPQWTYWYMLSLVYWKIISHFMPKNYYMLALVIIASLGINIFNLDADYFSFVRTVTLYPFYYFGYLIDPEKFKAASKKIPKHLAISSIISIIIASYIVFIKCRVSTKLLHFKHPYLKYADSITEGIILRFIFMILAFICIFAIFRLVTDKETVLTKWGANSFVLYLTHSIVLRAVTRSIKLPSDVNILFNFVIFSFIFAFGYCELFSGKLGKKLKPLTSLIK